jgi:hypothetical protein
MRVFPYFTYRTLIDGEEVIRVYHGFSVIRYYSGDTALARYACFLDGWFESYDWHNSEEL